MARDIDAYSCVSVLSMVGVQGVLDILLPDVPVGSLCTGHPVSVDVQLSRSIVAGVEGSGQKVEGCLR